MPSPRVDLPLPRTWMLTVRALEVSTLLVLGSILVEVWQSWRASGDYYPPVSADGLPVPATLMQRIVGFVMMGSYGTPATVMAPALCVGAAVAVLHLAKPVENARVLRWEVLAAGLATALYCLGVVLLAVVVVFGDNPFDAQQPGVVNGYRGPSLLERSIGVGALPLAALVMVAAAGLWWLRLPVEFDEEAEEAGNAGGTKDTEEPKPRRGWRPLPAQDANRDDFALDGVEVIEPVERLHPRDDDGTGSAYEDYLRRF
jgi:hypothetical protein